MLAELQKRVRRSSTPRDETLKQLNKDLVEVSTGIERLYEGVEKGVLPMDDTLTQRTEKLQKRRQSILLEIAGLKREKQMPVLRVGPKAINAFIASLRDKLLEPGSRFARGYLKLLISEIRLEGNQVLITGSYAALAHAVAMPQPDVGRVPRSVPDWLPGTGSNRRPSD